MKTQKTAFLTNIETIEIQKGPIPSPSTREVLIKVEAVGICGSDVSYYLNGSTGVGKLQFPHILGHECSGIVVQVGEGSRYTIGDRVAVEPGVPCCSCSHCLSGHYNRCENISFMSSARKLKYSDGAFAEYIVRPDQFVFSIDDSISFEQGALIEPLSVAYHAIQRSGVKAGQKVAILGCGPIASCVLIVLRAMGVSDIFMTDIIEHRLKQVKNLGASSAYNTKKISAEEIQLLESGVDVVFDTTCNEQAINSSLKWLNKGGTLTLIGVFSSSLNIDLQTLFLKEQSIVTSFRYVNTYMPCISLVSNGLVDPTMIVSHHYPIDRIAEAFEMAVNHKDEVMKIIIDF